MPITVGLYAKWGSGKSFLLGKLRQEMGNFAAREWIDPGGLHLSPLLLFLLLQAAALVGVAAWATCYGLNVDNGAAAAAGVAAPVGLIVLVYAFLIGVWRGSYAYDVQVLADLSEFLARQFSSLRLILHVLFCHPPGPEDPTQAAQVRRMCFRMVLLGNIQINIKMLNCERLKTFSRNG